MTSFQALLCGRSIVDVYVDSGVSYIMLDDGAQVTIHGTWIVEPCPSSPSPSPSPSPPVK